MKAVSGIYGFLGMMSLPSIIFLWDVVRFNALHPDDIFLNISFLAIPIVNTTLCFLISYLVWNSRRWGRYLALSYNAIWLTAFTVGPIVGRLTEDNFPALTSAAILFWSVVICGFGWLTVYFLRQEVRAVMLR